MGMARRQDEPADHEVEQPLDDAVHAIERVFEHADCGKAADVRPPRWSSWKTKNRERYKPRRCCPPV
jgi:hypothetical protein